MINLSNSCDEIPDRQYICSCQRLKSEKSLSEIKSPTVNSSFLLSYSPSRNLPLEDPQLVCQIKANNTQLEPVQNIFLNQTLTGRMNVEFPQIIQFKQHFDNNTKQNTKTLVNKFIERLIQNTYFHKMKVFNSVQRKILTEKYLVIPNNNNQKDNYISLICYIVWETLMLVINIFLSIGHPIQVGLHLLDLQTFIKILTVFMLIDSIFILLGKLKKLEVRQKNVKLCLNRNIDCFSFAEISYYSSYSITLFSSVDNNLIILSLLIHMYCSLTKLQQKYVLLSDWHSFDLHIYIFIGKMLIFLHYFACIWYFIGMSTNSSWVSKLELNDTDNYTIYCYSLYLSSASLLGFGQGNLIIKTNIELLFSAFIMFLSCFIYSNILHFVFVNLKEAKKNETQIRLRQIDSFFSNRKISMLMKIKIRNHIRNYSTQELDEQLQTDVAMLEQLPTQLKEELLSSMRAEAVSKCEVIQTFSINTLEKLTLLMDYIHLLPNEIIKQSDQSLYILERGQIEVQEFDKAIFTLKSDDYFGQYSFFSGNTSSTQFKVIEPSTVFKISQNEFVKLIQQHPLDYERYMFIKHSIQQGNYRIINMNCYSCKSTSHLIKDCPNVNYKPDLASLIKAGNAGFSERQSFARNRKINTRVNNQVFKRLLVSQDELKNFRIKYDFPSFCCSSEQNDCKTAQNEFSDPILSINKSAEIQERLTDRKLIPNTSIKDNYKHQSESNCISQVYHDKISQTELQKQQEDRFGQKTLDLSSSSLPQLELSSQQNIAAIDQKPEGAKTKNSSLSRNIQFKKMQSMIQPENIKRNLPSILEEDPYTLSLTTPNSQAQMSAHFTKCLKYSSDSIPQENTIYINSSQKIDLPNQYFHYPLADAIFPSALELVDLSSYAGNIRISLENFERMYQYTIYFPQGNITSVIQSLNSPQQIEVLY